MCTSFDRHGGDCKTSRHLALYWGAWRWGCDRNHEAAPHQGILASCFVPLVTCARRCARALLDCRPSSGAPVGARTPILDDGDDDDDDDDGEPIFPRGWRERMSHAPQCARREVVPPPGVGTFVVVDDVDVDVALYGGDWPTLRPAHT